MASRSALPLRNAQAANRKTTRKPARRPKVAQLVRPPEEMFPEILELPFCKYVGRPPGEDQCDWWSVPINGDDGLADELLGRHYALLTARFLHASKKADPLRSSVLLHIFGCMIERGVFWGLGRNGKQDTIAIGFVSGISDIMRWAYANGSVLNMASQLSEHYDACAKKATKERAPKKLRTALTRASEAHRHFVVESSERRPEARP